MSKGKPYDAAVRTLLGTNPQDWLRFLNLPPFDAPVTVLDTDVSVVSAATDGLLRVDGDSPFGLHFEFESGHHGSELPARLCAYNALASERAGLVFWSVLVLLNQKADSPALTGTLERALPSKKRVCTFEYEVIRTWQIEPERFIEAGFGLMAFAPTGKIADAQLPALIERMTQIIEEAVTDKRLTDTAANDFWAATYVLFGGRHDEDFAQLLMRKVSRMRESSTFQAILREGREEGLKQGLEQGLEQGLRQSVLRIGTKRFGTPGKKIVARLDAVTALAELEALEDQLLAVETWDELLASA
ncbi:MAG: hypothetical protein H7Y38_13425 [Armatimonadetes bacterium]|nr:hypothetical protein [Armatimonadota bacterium]